MDKTKMQPLKGFRDFLPEKMVVRNEAIRRLRSVFEKYGFEELQTPALEYQEVLLGKYGEEAEKLMYLFKDPGGRDVGLRYDLTVPLARVAATYPNLTLPFKRFQIQKVWRAEKPQKSRYREVLQCDIDTIGSSSPISDAEIVAVIHDSLKMLEFPDFITRINSRNVLFASMEKAGVSQEKWLTIIQTIDKLDKKSREEVEKELSEKGLAPSLICDIFNAFENAKPDKFLQEVMDVLKNMDLQHDNVIFDAKLARGLDYYTGPIYETTVIEPKIGSVTGGGRYDGLLKSLGGPDLPALGTTIGLDRAVDVIEELGLWKNLPSTNSQILITVFSPEFENKSIEVADKIRKQGINTEIYPSTNTKLEKQLKYADKKGIKWLVVIGPDEVKKNKVILKDLQSGHQEETKVDRLISIIKG